MTLWATKPFGPPTGNENDPSPSDSSSRIVILNEVKNLLVGGDVSDRSGLTGGMRRLPWGAGEVPRRGVRVASGSTCLRHRYLASRPRTCLLDRPARALVSRTHLLEQMQHVFSAIGRPRGEKPVIRVLQLAATANGDEPRVAFLGQDQRFTNLGYLGETSSYSGIQASSRPLRHVAPPLG